MLESRTHRLLALLSVAVLVMAILGDCGGVAPAITPTPETNTAQPLKPVSLGSGQKLNVVTTTNIIGDVVGNVGGDRIALTALMKVGVDPHEYVPTPSDAAFVHDANVVFINGAGLEANLEEMLTSAGGSAARIALSDGLDLHPAPTGGEEELGQFDPHVWFDVQNVIRWVETIDNTLSALDPANTQYYAANASAYTQQLRDLDTWVQEQIAQIPPEHRKLVTNHPAFGYLAARYGLEQVGAIYPVNPASEPSAQDVAALEDTIRQLAVPAIFTESTVNPKLAEQVAQDTGVKVVSLFTDSLGGPGSGSETYIEMMHFDVNAIVQTLK